MLPGFILRSHLLGHMSQIETAIHDIHASFYISCYYHNFNKFKGKNPTTLEAGRKEPKRYIIPWALLGFVLLWYIVIISLIYFNHG